MKENILLPLRFLHLSLIHIYTVLDDAVDFVKISEGMGAKAFRVTKMEEVEPAIRKALAMDEPVVLDCWIDQDLSVFPMVPAGASLNEVFDEEDMKLSLIHI